MAPFDHKANRAEQAMSATPHMPVLLTANAQLHMRTPSVMSLLTSARLHSAMSGCIDKAECTLLSRAADQKD